MTVSIMSVVVTNDIPLKRINIQAMTVIDVGRVRMGSLHGARKAMLAATRPVKPHVGGHGNPRWNLGSRQVVKCHEQRQLALDGDSGKLCSSSSTRWFGAFCSSLRAKRRRAA